MRLQKITKQQMLDAFITNLALGSPTEEAARKAGFSSPARDIAAEMHNPDFVPRVSKAIRHRVATTLAPQAMKVAETMLNSKNTSPRIRWDIAKTLLAAGAGMVAPKPAVVDDAPKDIATMTGADIMRLRESLEREMAARANNARLIEHQPHQGSENDSQQVQDLDFLD